MTYLAEIVLFILRDFAGISISPILILVFMIINIGGGIALICLYVKMVKEYEKIDTLLVLYVLENTELRKEINELNKK